MKPVFVFVLVALALAALLGSQAVQAVRLARGAQAVRTAGGGLRQNGELKFLVDVIETTTGGIAPTSNGAGVLLNPSWVLTTKAALTHTSWGFLKGFHIEVGKSKGGDGKKVDIDKQVDSEDGVLTLVKLKTPVAYDALNRPVNLPFPDVNNTDVDALLVGWSTDKKRELQAASIRVLAAEDCSLSPAASASLGVLCTADKEVATCEGDDGSPLVQDLKSGVFKLLGLAVETKGAQCPPADGAVRRYADVTKYTEWVVSTAFAR